MTTDTISTSSCPTVFEAGLPVLDWPFLTDLEQAHRHIAAARSQSPIGVNQDGAEVLTYGLVRTVLRDDRFGVHGLGLDAQGVTSGPLWDRATKNILGLDGQTHHRLRRLVSKAFAPSARSGCSR